MKKLNVKSIEEKRKENHQSDLVDQSARRIHSQTLIEKNREGSRKVTIIDPSVETKPCKTKRKLRVAAYCRVSTAEEAQLNSFEMQVYHFKRIISENPSYSLVKVYADEGISGTSTRNRSGFNQMISDAEAGKIDLIMTKSISRFGRNIVDVLSALRTLSNLVPPVAVFFETEGISTSDGQNSLIISILSALAEMESQMKSEAVKAGIRYRMSEGIYNFSTSNILGFYRDYTGCVRIEPNEAKIVEYIYDSFIDGMSYANIAEELTDIGILSPTQKPQWYGSTVKSILTNEKYCGDVLYQKTYTKDFRSHVSTKNNGILRMWRWESILPAIIPREKWELVQKLIADNVPRTQRNPYKPVKQLPSITRVKNGQLAGFYLLDMRWNSYQRLQFLQMIQNEKEHQNYE